MDRVGEIGWIQIDCRDPMALAAFWGEVLGQDIDPDYLGDPPQYVGLVPPNPDLPQVNFQRVPESKTVKNRLHFRPAGRRRRGGDGQDRGARRQPVPGRGWLRIRLPLARDDRPRGQRVLSDLRGGRRFVAVLAVEPAEARRRFRQQHPP
jgi:hypothetical protein